MFVSIDVNRKRAHVRAYDRPGITGRVNVRLSFVWPRIAFVNVSRARRRAAALRRIAMMAAYDAATATATRPATYRDPDPADAGRPVCVTCGGDGYAYHATCADPDARYVPCDTCDGSGRMPYVDADRIDV